MKLKELVEQSSRKLQKSLTYKELFNYLTTFTHTDTKQAANFIAITIPTGSDEDKFVPEYLIREVQDEIEQQMVKLEEESQKILEREI